MMDFIMVPIIVGVVTLGIYKLFELFVRRKERLIMVEKMGDKLDPSMLNGSAMEPLRLEPLRILGNISTGALKTGCLLTGIGLGLIVGLFIARMTFPNGIPNWDDRASREIAGVIYGASVLLFGGLSLLAAFLIEIKLSRKKD